MFRNIFTLLIFTAFLSSCGNSANNESSSKPEVTDAAMKVEFASLIEDPDSFIGQNIIIEGKVVHVCTHSGKKLFIVGENPDVRLFISAGEDMPKFPMELLGSEVVVEGRITKIAGQELPKGNKHKEGEGDGKGKALHPEEMTKTDDSCETETALAIQPALANIIMEYKNHTVK